MHLSRNANLINPKVERKMSIFHRLTFVLMTLCSLWKGSGFMILRELQLHRPRHSGEKGDPDPRIISGRNVSCYLSSSSSTKINDSHEKDLIPPGRIEDIDEWVRLSSNSLQRLFGKSLFEEIGLVGDQAVPYNIHTNTRYGVLSHGIQDDPIYHYFNQAALDTFGYSEDEIYQLPSRYSAPDFVRQERNAIVQEAVAEDVRIFPLAIRQTKTGTLFQIHGIILWNVYNDNGNRVGQTAIYDRNKITPYTNTTSIL